MSWTKSVINLARTARSLGAKPAAKTKPAGPREKRPGRGALSNEVVARIKRDLLCYPPSYVAQRHSVRTETVCRIQREEAYRDVKPAPSTDL